MAVVPTPCPYTPTANSTPSEQTRITCPNAFPLLSEKVLVFMARMIPLHRLARRAPLNRQTDFVCASNYIANRRSCQEEIQPPAKPVEIKTRKGISMQRIALTLLLACSTLAVSAPPPPVHLTAEQDHRRLLDLLHIQSLRPGADPRHPQAPASGPLLPINPSAKSIAPATAIPQARMGSGRTVLGAILHVKQHLHRRLS